LGGDCTAIGDFSEVFHYEPSCPVAALPLVVLQEKFKYAYCGLSSAVPHIDDLGGEF